MCQRAGIQSFHIASKLVRLKSIVSEVLSKADAKLIIFTQFRDSALEVRKFLSDFSCELFVSLAILLSIIGP